MERDPLFADLLINTGDKPIQYNSQQNSFLGIGSDGKGQNVLGKLYEALRYRLKTEKRRKNKSDELSRKDEQIYEIYKIILYLNNEIDQIIYDNATLDDFLHKYDEYSYTNFADLVSPKPERQGEYLNKQIIIENYNEGVLKDKHIIDEILKNKGFCI